MANISQLAILKPLPTGGINNPPQINGAIVNSEDNPSGNQLYAQSTQMRAGTVTSAQLLALKGADIQLVPAPGAGFALCLEGISMRINSGTVVYTLNGGTLKVYQGPSASGIPLCGDLAAILQQAAVSDNIGIPATAAGVQTQAASENVALVLGNAGAAQFTLGNGTLDVVVIYSIVQM